MISKNDVTDTARHIDVRNPRSGKLDYQFAVPSIDDIKSTVTRLRQAQPAWVRSGVANRIKLLEQWQHSLLNHRNEIVNALALDTGRRLIAEQEFEGLMRSLERWCSLAPDLLAGKSQAAAALPQVEIYADAEPFPVLGAISPWNFPLLLSFIDVTPALLAGCAAFIKPSEVTPRFAEPLAKSIADVPELAEVLVIQPGDGETGQNLIGQVDVVAFTGSVATGQKVAVAAAQSFIPAFLELGGKDPAIVLSGTDLDRATTSILRASVSATGQACQSLERLYVAQDDYDAFTEMLVEKASAVELSKDEQHSGNIGPLIFARQADIISAHLADACNKGATIRCGGEVLNDHGAFWIKPTVLTGVDHSMQVMVEETFGPIMPVMPFSTESEAVALANDSHYGLSAAVFGPNEESALQVARQLSAGGISVNDAGMTTMLFETEKSAFGYSGLGPSRVGPSGLTRFLRRKSLYLNRGAVTPLSVFNENTGDT